ncbi:hypothetical protein KFZ76_16245 [Methylovulum psychrotolerans]|uniref:hypothetical protein n=1 Tax=Methylovulum psychrotolerans TaxID=1704499 RepID=UPI001BFFC6A9|nr:hypothetical protein [Methylovulum psychrotolerans]MBT9099245.1 hypothetical protein [Methylovulum psychrotolerans]
MSDILIKWKSSGKENFFEKIGVKSESDSFISKALDLDVTIFFEAALTPVANVIIKKLENKINNDNIKVLTNVVIYSLLRSITDGELIADNDKIKFFPNNEFRELKKLFKETSFGTVYIDKLDINDAILLELLDVLCLEEIFKEKNDKYYLIGYHLENLEIG